jgi:hypothetical protein
MTHGIMNLRIQYVSMYLLMVDLSVDPGTSTIPPGTNRRNVAEAVAFQEPVVVFILY